MFEEGNRGGGKVGNLALVFHFSIRLRRRSGGNVEISPAFGEISKGLVERGVSLLLAFHAFHSPVISTALSLSFFAVGFAPRAWLVGDDSAKDNSSAGRRQLRSNI
jgi:hypothetical protein